MSQVNLNPEYLKLMGIYPTEGTLFPVQLGVSLIC